MTTEQTKQLWIDTFNNCIKSNIPVVGNDMGVCISLATEYANIAVNKFTEKFYPHLNKNKSSDYNSNEIIS